MKLIMLAMHWCDTESPSFTLAPFSTKSLAIFSWDFKQAKSNGEHLCCNENDYSTTTLLNANNNCLIVNLSLVANV